MTPVDILFVNPGDRRQVYQALGDEFCAIEPPALAGLFAPTRAQKGARVAILDVPALGAGGGGAAWSTRDFAPTLVATRVYGFQPSASTQNMTSAGASRGW